MQGVQQLLNSTSCRPPQKLRAESHFLSRVINYLAHFTAPFLGPFLNAKTAFKCDGLSSTLLRKMRTSGSPTHSATSASSALALGSQLPLAASSRLGMPPGLKHNLLAPSLRPTIVKASWLTRTSNPPASLAEDLPPLLRWLAHAPWYTEVSSCRHSLHAYGLA